MALHCELLVINLQHNSCFRTGRGALLQVMVVPADLCWGLAAEAQQVVIMGTQYYDGSAGGGGTDYPVTDLLQMMGRAIRAKDTPQGSGRCVCVEHASWGDSPPR